MPLYDYRCSSCNLVVEKYERYENRQVRCTHCIDGTMIRQPTMPNISRTRLAKGKNASRDAVDQWENMRKKKMAIEQKNKENHGTYD